MTPIKQTGRLLEVFYPNGFIEYECHSATRHTVTVDVPENMTALSWLTCHCHNAEMKPLPNFALLLSPNSSEIELQHLRLRTLDMVLAKK